MSTDAHLSRRTAQDTIRDLLSAIRVPTDGSATAGR